MDNSNDNTRGNINEKKRKSEESSGETVRGKAGRSGELDMQAVDSITDIAAHLHGLLQSKEKELKEREAEFERRVKLFESENPSIGNGNDVIQLNVGGSVKIAVLRRTLTQFEGSMLAAKFSGRWDDSMEKDRDGNIFVDQDPDQFIPLINYLRLRMNSQSRQVPARHLPQPTYSFCSMLDYYNLMPAIYPQQWNGLIDAFSCEEKSYGTVVLSTKNANAEALVLHDFNLNGFGRDVSEFTVVFEKGTLGSVGWIDCRDRGKESVLSHRLDKSIKNSIFLSITERKIFGPNAILEENMRIDHNMESATKVTCRHDGQSQRGEYSIEVINVSSPGGVVATLQKARRAESNNYHRVFPMISFSGMVTVSGLKYAIDEL